MRLFPARLLPALLLAAWLPALAAGRAQEPAAPAAAGETPPSGDTMIAEMAALAAKFTKASEEPTGMFVHDCRFVQGETLKRALEDFLSPAGTVACGAEGDGVVVVDRESQLPVLRQIAAAVDREVPQVLVSARVVEFTITSGFEKQINTEFQQFRNLEEIPGLPANSTGFVNRLTDAFLSPSGDPAAAMRGAASLMSYDPEQQTLLSVYLKFLESKGHAQVLSAPNLILRRGSEGNIITGQEVPIQSSTQTGGANITSTTFKSVGIKLRVAPLMIAGGRVRLQVSPEVSNVQEYTSAGAPLIAVRSANTELDMVDGQMVSIGGLLRKEKRRSARRVPLLGSLPVLGFLFTSHADEAIESQLVIFLRASIIKPGEMNAATISPAAIAGEMVRHGEQVQEGLTAEPPSSLESDLRQLKGE
ncbi:MAG: type II and III secretion system protein [Lentisphaeria bacterium]|jgi:type II secretory pathway component GspD/PulD (secretin)